MHRFVSVAVALRATPEAFALGGERDRRRDPPPVKKISITGATCANGLYCYKPAALTVKKGTKVVWTNASGTIHTVTAARSRPAVAPGTGKQTKFGQPRRRPQDVRLHLRRAPGPLLLQGPRLLHVTARHRQGLARHDHLRQRGGGRGAVTSVATEAWGRHIPVAAIVHESP